MWCASNGPPCCITFFLLFPSSLQHTASPTPQKQEKRKENAWSIYCRNLQWTADFWIMAMIQRKTHYLTLLPITHKNVPAPIHNTRFASNRKVYLSSAHILPVLLQALHQKPIIFLIETWNAGTVFSWFCMSQLYCSRLHIIPANELKDFFTQNKKEGFNFFTI